MAFQGRVWKFGDDVNTDEIIPARFLSTADEAELAKNVMVGIDEEFPQKVKPGDIIVAGKNFGCGSSREHAPVAIRGAGIACVIARGFARIFYRNAFNTGLLILESPELIEHVETGHILEVDPDAGTILHTHTSERFDVKPVPPFMQELLRDGGLIPHIRKRAAKA